MVAARSSRVRANCTSEALRAQEGVHQVAEEDYGQAEEDDLLGGHRRSRPAMAARQRSTKSRDARMSRRSATPGAWPLAHQEGVKSGPGDVDGMRTCPGPSRTNIRQDVQDQGS